METIDIIIFSILIIGFVLCLFLIKHFEKHEQEKNKDNKKHIKILWKK